MEVSKTKNALGIALFGLCIFIIYQGSQNGTAIFIAALVIVVPLLKISFILASDFLLGPILNRVGGLFYSANVEKKIEYPHIDGMIIKHQYSEALEELKEIIGQDPKDGLAHLKYCELLIDHFNQQQEALELAYQRLNRKQLDEFDVKLVLLSCDLLTQGGHHSNARELLTNCLQKTNDAAYSKNLQQRLDYLETGSPKC